LGYNRRKRQDLAAKDSMDWHRSGGHFHEAAILLHEFPAWFVPCKIGAILSIVLGANRILIMGGSTLRNGFHSVRTMRQRVEVNGTSEHSLYLRLFVTTSGGV